MGAAVLLPNGKPAGHARGETRLETLQRHVVKAREHGVTLIPVYGHENVFVAPSTGETNMVYVVRPGNVDHGCSCPGYVKHRYCKHYALALVVSGIMPDPTPPSAPAAAAIPVPIAEPELGWCVACGAFGPMANDDVCTVCDATAWENEWESHRDYIAAMDECGWMAS